MVDVYYIDSITQVRAIAEPTRWHILDLLVVRPMTGSQLARALNIPRTRAHYHLNILREVGLVELQHEQLNGGMMEKYYRAVARQFRTDHLVDRTRLAAGQSGDDIGTGQVVRDLMLAMLELARADILLPNALAGLAQAGFNFQDELLLTPEQTNALILALRELGSRFLDLDHQNHVAPGASGLLPLRLTSLLTPVSALNFDSQPKSRGAEANDDAGKTAGERQVHEAEGTD
jgi:DNA-binding transcriptional ArsR family regulator